MGMRHRGRWTALWLRNSDTENILRTELASSGGRKVPKIPFSGLRHISSFWKEAYKEQGSPISQRTRALGPGNKAPT